MNQYPKRRLWLTLIVISLGSWSSDANADIGPKPNDRQYMTVKLDGQSLQDTYFLAAMLSEETKLREQPLNMGKAVPGLNAALRAKRSTDNWSYANYLWGGAGKNGEVDFGGFAYGGVPKRFRIAIYLPSQDKIFITDAAETHPLLHRFLVDLTSNGTGTLVRDQTGQWLADRLVGLARHGMFRALAITLVVEWLVVGLMILVLKKRQLLIRMMVTCLCVNLATLPVLWVVCLVAFWMFGLWTGFLILIWLELIVFILEGSTYATIGRLNWKWGLTVSLLANIASIAVGIIFNQGTTW